MIVLADVFLSILLLALGAEVKIQQKNAADHKAKEAHDLGYAEHTDIAAIIGSAAFLFPLIVTSPPVIRPPLIRKLSMYSPVIF